MNKPSALGINLPGAARGLVASAPGKLREEFFDRLAVIHVKALAAGHFESVRIQSQLVPHRGVEAEFVGLTILKATLHAATDQLGLLR